MTGLVGFTTLLGFRVQLIDSQISLFPFLHVFVELIQAFVALIV